MKLLLEDRIKAIQDDPHERLARIGLQPGMRVVDLGAGKGLYSLLSSSMVGREGMVYAIEPDSSRAAMIERRVSSERLENVRILATGAENLAEVHSSTVDIAFALNSMHHFSDKAAAFAEVYRVLKTGGKFYVRDMIRSWLTWHGTRREEIPNLPSAGYSGKSVSVTRSRLEATFTK